MIFILLPALLGLMGLALVVLGLVELVRRAGRRGRPAVGAAFLGTGLLLFVDLTLWAKGYAPYTNRA